MNNLIIFCFICVFLCSCSSQPVPSSEWEKLAKILEEIYDDGNVVKGNPEITKKFCSNYAYDLSERVYATVNNEYYMDVADKEIIENFVEIYNQRGYFGTNEKLKNKSLNLIGKITKKFIHSARNYEPNIDKDLPENSYDFARIQKESCYKVFR